MTQLETLRAVFQGRVFVVPDYQRGYSWEAMQRTDLLNDLEGLAHIHPDKDHFTGTLVLHVKPEGPKTFLGQRLKRVDIVDGQQRLTTLVILLHCLAQQLARLSQTSASRAARDIRESFVQLRAEDEAVRKLHLQDSSDQFFADFILNGRAHPAPRVPADQHLMDAKEEFTSFLGERHQSADRSDEWYEFLLDLKERITERLGFVVYEVEDEAEVGVMFEVMNSRGKPLTELEKVKNYLLYVVSKTTSGRPLAQLSNIVNSSWKELLRVLQQIESADEDQFLQHHWVIYPEAPESEDPTKTSSIHRAVKSLFSLRKAPGQSEIQQGVKRYARSLREGALSYRDLVEPTWPESFQAVAKHRDQLRTRVQAIERIGRPATTRPLLMLLYQRLETRPDELLELFRLAEVFVFRTAAMEFRADTGRNKIYRYARKLSLSEEIVYQEVRGWMTDELIRNYCSDQRLLTALEDSERDFYRWNQLLFFLYEYEKESSSDIGQDIPIDWDELAKRDKQETIEHILPQGDSTLDKSYWGDRFSKDEWRSYRHRLGNLCITQWNSTYYNKGFDKKRGSETGGPKERGYRNSGWVQERELTEWEEWTTDAIEERHERLVQFALRRWSITS